MNEKPRQLVFDEENLNKLRAGVDKLANAVKVTLGPKGRNVIIERPYGSPSVTKDGVSVAKEVELLDPIENLGAQMAKDVAAKTCDEAGDGPQPLYSKVFTPTGFTTMGNLKVGDTVCGTNNTFQEVIGVYPKGEKEIIKITFSNGRVVECCEDHVWDITTRNGQRKVITVREMLSNGVFHEDSEGNKRYNFYVPKTSVDFVNTNFILDPYLLGVLLGDGSLSSLDGNIEISIGARKEHIIAKLVLPQGFSTSISWVENKNYYRIKIKGKDSNGDTFQNVLQKIGLLGTTSLTKYIPKEYLYSSLEDRNQLLQGLLDTDGYMNNRGLFEFSTVSDQMKIDFESLCLSMGRFINYRFHTRENDEGSYSDRPIHRFIELKGYKYGDKIIQIERTGEKTQMQCIKVSNPDNLYITDGFVVTHNTTTATVLAQAIMNEGITSIIAGKVNPVELKRGMDKAVNAIVAELREIAIPVDGNLETIARVGSVSANNEREVGDILAEAIDKVGRDGVITIEESDKQGLSLSEIQGIEFNEGLMSQAFLQDPNDREIRFEQPTFFIVNKDISSSTEIAAGLKSALQRDDPAQLVLVCRGCVKTVIDQSALMVKTGRVRMIMVKAPGYKEQQENFIRDLAIATGATVYGETTNGDTSLGLAKVQDMGQAESLKITMSKTTILNPMGDSEKVLSRIESLRAIVEETKSEYDREKLLDRIAKLSGAVAVINVGGRSEVEVKELRDRVEDAMHATRAAVEEGIVAGGGAALLQVRAKARKAIKLQKLPLEQHLGTEIVFKAIEAPLLNILFNAGVNSERLRPDVVLDRIQSGKEKGYNAYTEKFEDLVETGIIDPVKVTITALRNAVSIAGMLLTTSCSITYDREHQPIATQDSVF